MKKDCGFHSAKYLLCSLNFVALLVSTIGLAVGIWLATDRTSFLALLNMMEAEQLKNAAGTSIYEQIGIVLAAFGATLVILSFLGCFGAVRDSRCLLALYGILLVLFFIAEVVVVTLAYIYKDEARDYTKSLLRESMLTYSSTVDQTDIMTRLWNGLMASFHCCGVNDYQDLAKLDGWTKYKGNRTIPESCCILRNVAELIPRDSDCVTEPNENNSFLTTGCYGAITTWLVSRREILFCIFLTIDVVIFFCAFLAFTLCKSISRIKRIRL